MSWQSPPREPIPTSADAAAVCAFSLRWGIAQALASRLSLASDYYKLSTGKRPLMISGLRTIEMQEKLRRQGRPTADPSRSTHLTCPATGADVSLGFPVTDGLKWAWGLAAERAGLRWGGGSPRDEETKIPSDWGHVDLGPREG